MSPRLRGVLGAVMVGWGVALLFVLVGPFRRLSAPAWRSLVVSILAWFVPDTMYSLSAGERRHRAPVCTGPGSNAHVLPFDDRNFVKKAVNWALRQVSKRSLDLHGPALTAPRTRTSRSRWPAG